MGYPAPSPAEAVLTAFGISRVWITELIGYQHCLRSGPNRIKLIQPRLKEWLG
jgi:hypothetical protein